MFCSRCGTEVQKATQFCPTCGLDLRVTTPVQAIATGDVSELDVVRDALQEEYELLEELGRGGMAIVYRARDKHLEREVAIKVLPFSLAFDQEFVERFTREARTAAQLEHPNIISIYRVGKTGRVIYFTMKLVRGGSLSGLMGERKKLTPPEIRKLLAEVGSALGYAHTRGIVHRDIKPDNIMFDEFGQCVVTDFGIAKAGSGSKLTGTGMSIGTPHYMSPEQARAQSIDGRSDLYSLGILAYQALVGEVPYDGEDSFAIGYKHIMEPIPVPLLDTPDERRLFEVIKRLIQKDPLDRFQTAEDLLRALEGQPLAQAARRASQAQATMAVQPGTPSPASPLQRPSVAHIPTPPPPAPRPSIAVPPVAPSVDTPRRPVMRRSVAAVQETQQTNWVPWVLAAIVLLAVIIGAAYLYRRGALGNAERQAAADSMAKATPVTPVADSIDTAAYDTALAGIDTAGLRSSPNVPLSSPNHATTPVSAVTDTGFGFLRLRNLPPRSVVLIDSRPVTQPGGNDIRLSAGWHELGITSPGFALFTDSVKIESGRTLSFGPNLASAQPGAAEPGSRQEMRNRLLARMDCDNPAPLNRFGRECYDTPPQPLASTLVPVPAGIDGMPSGVTVIVKVSYQGRTLVVRTRNASNDERFTRAVEAYAGTMRWTPAMRDGQPVDGWTQYAFQPATP